jgi:hypothetical protein
VTGEQRIKALKPQKEPGKPSDHMRRRNTRAIVVCRPTQGPEASRLRFQTARWCCPVRCVHKSRIHRVRYRSGSLYHTEKGMSFTNTTWWNECSGLSMRLECRATISTALLAMLQPDRGVFRADEALDQEKSLTGRLVW